MRDLTGETKLLAVVGRPVSHSLSPRIQNAFAARHGLPYAYLAFDIGPERLGEFTEAARLLGMGGFNLTMPHKERVLPLLDELDGAARRCGAVNTVAVRDGALYGYNTDGDGFIHSLKNIPRSALVLGAGGAGRTVALALEQRGVEVTVAVRRAREPISPGIRYVPWDKLFSAAKGKGLIVNATPLGMRGVAADFEDLSFLDAPDAGATVYDLIYAPRETALLRAARAKGFQAINGLPHLVWQAALAFRHFTGVMPNNAEEVLEELSHE